MYFEIREDDIDRHLQSEAARALLAAWRAERRGDSLPLVDAFWYADLPARGHLVLATPDGDDDWRYAMVGTALAREEGEHWRAETVSGLAEPDRSFVRRCFGIVTDREAPLYAVHSAPNSNNVLLWERLALPCRGADGTVAVVTLLRPLEYVEDMVRAVLDSTPTAIVRARCVRDAEGDVVDAVCLLANERAAAFLHCNADDLDQGCLLELFPSFWDDGVFQRFVTVVETREPAHFEMRHRYGEQEAWFSVSVVALADGFTLSLADITARKAITSQLERARNELLAANAHLERQADELEAAIAAANAARIELEAEVECRKVLEEELRRLAMTDALTGLANRPAIAAQGQALAASAQKRAAPLSVISLDVDRFKSVNDAHGHAAGDKVLDMVAGLLQELSRPDLDVAGRLGGEEFVVILPRTGLAAAAVVAERMRAALAGRSVDVGGTWLGVTASFGVAEFTGREEFEELLARCDEALYRAKREGRDRVAVAPMPETLAA